MYYAEKKQISRHRKTLINNTLIRVCYHVHLFIPMDGHLDASPKTVTQVSFESFVGYICRKVKKETKVYVSGGCGVK